MLPLGKGKLLILHGIRFPAGLHARCFLYSFSFHPPNERQSLSHQICQGGNQGWDVKCAVCCLGTPSSLVQGRDVTSAPAAHTPPPKPSTDHSIAASGTDSAELVSLDPLQCPPPHKRHKLGSMPGCTGTDYGIQRVRIGFLL